MQSIDRLTWLGLDNEDTVGIALACPYCHENRVDWLVWQDDHKSVECQSCHATYEPIDD